MRFIYQGAGRHLKIEKLQLDRESAKTLLEEEIFSLQALFANALSPYPGDISKEIEINERFKPKFFEKKQSGAGYSYFLLFSNDRFGLGAGDESVIKYKALVGFLYCEREEFFFKVRFFIPRQEETLELEQLFLSLRCQ